MTCDHGEGILHLKYLEEKGVIQQEMQELRFTYPLSEDLQIVLLKESLQQAIESRAI